MRKMLLILSAALALAAVPGAVFAQDATPRPTPVPFSQQALLVQLMGVMGGARQNPELAFTHDQAQKLLPLLQKLKANPNPGAADSKAIWTTAQAILTDEQKAFEPEYQDHRGTGQGTGNSNGQNLTPQERQAKFLDRLIQRLGKL